MKFNSRDTPMVCFYGRRRRVSTTIAEIIEKEISDVDFNARMKELMREFTSLTGEAHKLEKKITEDYLVGFLGT